MANEKENVTQMYEAILKLNDVEECKDFFTDLCSPKEISAMEQRFAVASLLMQERVYLEILEKTNASTATISRVNRMLNFGTGTMKEVINRLGE